MMIGTLVEGRKQMKNIIAVALVLFIIGGAIFLKLKKKKKN